MTEKTNRETLSSCNKTESSFHNNYYSTGYYLSSLHYTKQNKNNSKRLGLLLFPTNSSSFALTRLLDFKSRLSRSRAWFVVIVWSIIRVLSFGEFLFELKQKLLIFLIQKLSFLPQPLVLFHYVTVFYIQLWV